MTLQAHRTVVVKTQRQSAFRIVDVGMLRVNHFRERPHVGDSRSGRFIRRMTRGAGDRFVISRRADEQASGVVASLNQRIRINSGAEVPVVVLLQHV